MLNNKRLRSARLFITPLLKILLTSLPLRNKRNGQRGATPLAIAFTAVKRWSQADQTYVALAHIQQHAQVLALEQTKDGATILNPPVDEEMQERMRSLYTSYKEAFDILRVCEPVLRSDETTELEARLAYFEETVLELRKLDDGYVHELLTLADEVDYLKSVNASLTAELEKKISTLTPVESETSDTDPGVDSEAKGEPSADDFIDF